jgi:hypothetical protein
MHAGEKNDGTARTSTARLYEPWEDVLMARDIRLWMVGAMCFDFYSFFMMTRRTFSIANLRSL